MSTIGRRAASAACAEDGQSAVELVALLPLVVVVMMALGQVLAAGSAREQAGVAAQAAAMAIVQGGDPAQSAREAVPDWPRKRMDVRIEGRRVRVRLEPRSILPGTAELLVARASADAGPPA